MFEYVFGFLVGTITTYICFEGQRKQFDKVVNEVNERLNKLEGEK